MFVAIPFCATCKISEKDLRNLEIIDFLKQKMKEISERNADYGTVNKHLIWLLGMGKIEKIEKNKNIYYKLK